MKNHLGEREYRTYGAWLQAVKKIDPDAKIDGNKDMAYAFCADETILNANVNAIGEWTGDCGIIYHVDDDAYIPKSF